MNRSFYRIAGEMMKKLDYPEYISSASTKVAASNRPPTVCVGLPVYSGGTMLAGAIQCILSQDFEDLELIVTDLGSDRLTRETCLEFQRKDKRLRYIHTGDDIHHLGIRNIAAIIEHSRSPFFMWGSYDDRHKPTFVSKCLEVLEQDESVALVYPRSLLLKKNGEVRGLAADTIKADQEDPSERFLHVIRELDICTAFYGVFRTLALRRTRAFRYKSYRGCDCLLLAEISLLGKIVQIPEVLFERTFEREMKSFTRQQADIINAIDPILLDEGITLPFCRLVYAHCELINHSKLSWDQKGKLTQEILRCFRTRWDKALRFEIRRAMRLIGEGCFYKTWDDRTYDEGEVAGAAQLRRFHIADLLKQLEEALFIYPDLPGLRDAHRRCLDEFMGS